VGGVGPWSADTLQGSAYGGLLVRALERSETAEGMALVRLSFDLWRPVSRERITPSVTMLRDGRKARTVESSLAQGGKPVARCMGVFLKADAAATPAPVQRTHAPRRWGPTPGARRRRR
jgi:acyl-CoA thioesterase superfamily protein